MVAGADGPGAGARSRRVLRLAALVRLVALCLTLTVALLGGLVVAAEAFTDPGGWTAAGLVAGWVLSTTALIVVVGRRPDVAVGLVGAAVTGLLLLCGLATLPGGAAQDLESAHGPVRAVTALTLLCLAGLLGWARPRAAGVLLLALAVAPPVGSWLGAALYGGADAGTGATGAVTGAVTGPLLVVCWTAASIGALDLLVGATAGPRRP